MGTAYSTTAWSTFFSAQLSASAALTGLLFVAVSINLSKIVALRYLPPRAAKALTTLLSVLLSSTLCLVPAQRTSLLGWELTALGAAVWAMLTYWQRASSAGNPYVGRGHTVFHWILAEASGLPLLIAGISLIIARGGGLYWLVAGAMISFVAAMLDAWVLLVEIQR